MNKTRRTLIAGAALALLAVTAIGCDAVNDKNGIGDAPIGQRYDQPWDVIQAPDGFPNVITRCNPAVPGTRIYVVSHGKTDVPPVIVTDESCR